MKHASRSLHSWIARNVQITCALASILSIYLVTYGALTSQSAMVSVMRHSSDSQTAQGVTLTPHEKRQVAFVASIIETMSPSRKDSNTLASLIVTESNRAKIDPLFVTAVIQAESSFKPKAVSHKGAQGLMQLMPATGKHLSKRLNVRLRDVSALYDPKTNIKLGVAYLKELNQRFKGDKEHTLVAYNWGPTNVSKALDGQKRFPKSSVKYARSILSRHSSWSMKMNRSFAKSSIVSFG